MPGDANTMPSRSKRVLDAFLSPRHVSKRRATIEIKALFNGNHQRLFYTDHLHCIHLRNLRMVRGQTKYCVARKIQVLFCGHFSCLYNLGWHDLIRLYDNMCCHVFNFSPSMMNDHLNYHNDPEDDFFFDGTSIATIFSSQEFCGIEADDDNTDNIADDFST